MGVYVHPFFVYIGNNINVSKVLSSQVNKKIIFVVLVLLWAHNNTVLCWVSWVCSPHNQTCSGMVTVARVGLSHNHVSWYVTCVFIVPNGVGVMV